MKTGTSLERHIGITSGGPIRAAGRGFATVMVESLGRCAKENRGEEVWLRGAAGDADGKHACIQNETGGYEWVAVGDAEYVFRLAANGSAIGPTIADFFGANSAASLPASSAWELEAHLYFTKTTNGTIIWTITNSAANYTNIAAYQYTTPQAGIGTVGTVQGTGVVTTTTAAAALPVTANYNNGTSHYTRLVATVEMNAAGNVRIRATESAGTITPLRGSFYTLRRLPDSVGTFVA